MTTPEHPPEDQLTKSLFHKTMVVFYQPAYWPVWIVWSLVVGLAALAGVVWGLVSESPWPGLMAAGLFFAFVVGDILLLDSLSHRRISFAPWAGQLFPLATPRLLAQLLWALAIPITGLAPALILALLTQLAGSLALYRGAIVEPARLAISELTVRSTQLPPGSPALRLLHISDIHLERPGSREDRLLDLVTQARPDLILISGDYVNLSHNEDPVTHAAVRELLEQLRAPHGVYAVLGSPPVDLHEQIAPLFTNLPVVLLRQERCELDLGHGRQLNLIGMDCYHDIEFDAARLADLANGTNGDKPRVLLYHSPELMPQAAALGLDLYLCGHTHGGQVRLPLIGPVLTSSQLGRRYVMGHYQEGATHLYVTRGVGFEGLSAPRVRFLCPPEILLVTMEPAGDADST